MTLLGGDLNVLLNGVGGILCDGVLVIEAVHVDVGLFQGVGNNIGNGPLAFGLGVDSELMENKIRLADQIHVAAKRVDEVVLMENEASGPRLACDLPSCRMDALYVVAVGEAICLEGEISAGSLQELVSQICVPVECDTFKERDGVPISAYFVALGASSDLSGEARLCEVLIAIVEDFDVTCGIRFEITSADVKGGNIKRRRGRPRKQSFKLNVSDSHMDIHSILDKKPFVVANTVWHMGLALGVSGYD
ncbi:hypothetical protein SESBI_01913 [Sesbania bispinosa]|nr:hypothetical protein SESBI_01913 [Sesbania bispinosa]